jgi:hypothetical protein
MAKFFIIAYILFVFLTDLSFNIFYFYLKESLFIFTIICQINSLMINDFKVLKVTSSLFCIETIS